MSRRILVIPLALQAALPSHASLLQGVCLARAYSPHQLLAACRCLATQPPPNVRAASL